MPGTMLPPQSHARRATDDIFRRGYGDLSGAMQARSGLTLAHFTALKPTHLEMRNADDCFTAVVVQREEDVDIRRDGRYVHRGLIPAGTVNFSDPSALSETTVRSPNDVLIFLLPIPLIASVAAHAGVGFTTDASFGFLHQAGKIDTRILALAREAQRELSEPGPFTRLRLDLIGQELIIRMLQGHSSLATGLNARRNGSYGGLAPWQLRRACEMMDASLEDGLTLGLLAAAVECSPTHFSRAFKQSTGIAPFAWLLHRRVERAKTLLLDPALSIADVALAVGFSAQPQFTTAFKRVSGTTPAAWRRSQMP